MNQPQPRILTLRRVVIFLCVILGLMHVILLGWTIQRQRAAGQLLQDTLVLEENLGLLQQIDQAQLDKLRNELEEIQGEVADLEASLPVLGKLFPIYRRGLDLAQASNLDLREISLTNSEVMETTSGVVVQKKYAIDTLGSLENCLDFLGNLEKAGMDTINLEFINIIPDQNQCFMEFNTFGYPDMVE